MDWSSVFYSFWTSLGFKLLRVNFGIDLPTIWLLVANEIYDAMMVSLDLQQITLQYLVLGKAYIVSFIYVSVFYHERRMLWSALTSIKASFHFPWLVVGDFNAIFGANEKMSLALSSNLL